MCACVPNYYSRQGCPVAHGGKCSNQEIADTLQIEHLFFGEGYYFDNDGGGEDDDGGEDVPAVECEEDEVEDDAEGEKDALAEGVTDGGPGEAGGEEAQADEVGDGGEGAGDGKA